jgi:glucose/arabinose dehydrogenase/PKD repeat protein
MRRWVVVLLIAGAASGWAGSGALAGTVPTKFQETVAFSGLSLPTSVAFAPNGRVFVAEKSGIIKVFDGLDDTTPAVLANLTNEAYNYWDRGLLGMVLDPEFPERPYVYVLYTLDAMPGESPPRWGGTSASDGCPTPPGPTADGCVATGRLSRLTVSGNAVTEETPLVTDWCQQYPSHSLGDLAFGADGNLYVSGGDGASFTFIDWGQGGSPLNPCGDPPAGVDGAMAPPTAEGGSLRAQDVRTPSDPTGLNGALLRVDPATGEGALGNPLAASSDPNARRIVGYGFRNPFRFTIRPGTNEVWIGDVGLSTWEEIDRLTAHGSAADNFGWPCYEGNNGSSARQPGWDAANADLCESLYEEGPSAVIAPYFSYNHAAKVVPGETCPIGSSSITGLDFYATGPFPNAYNGALFFADYSRNCIWAMLPGPGGLPDPADIQTFDAGASSPVDVKIGPDGALYYVDLAGGKIWRVAYSAGNHPPVAVANGTPENGPAPLDVQFSATGSTDPDQGDTLSYAWDLDGDGEFDDSTDASPSYVYAEPGIHVASVRVTDPDGASDANAVEIQVDNTPPTAQIASPSPGSRWAVGDQVAFSASASDPQDGALSPSAFDWEIVLNHCPSNCHQHHIEDLPERTEGLFTAPDHEYPSTLTIRLTVTDSGGLTDTKSVTIEPKTVSLSLQSRPPGLQLALNGEVATTPFSATVIEGSHNTVLAPEPQMLGDVAYAFGAWSNGENAAFDLTANQAQALTAIYGPPTAPKITAIDPSGPANANAPKVKGNVGTDFPAGIEIYASSNCTGAPIASGKPSQFSGAGISVSVPNDKATPLSAQATNAAGGSACSNSLVYVEDSTPPPAPTIATDPTSPANANDPKVKGIAEAGSTVRLYRSADCSGLKTTTTSAQFSAGLASTVKDNTRTTFTATATDSAGNISGCSASLVYVEDSTAPVTTITHAPPLRRFAWTRRRGRGARRSSARVSFYFTSNETGASYRCEFDGAGFSPCVEPMEFGDLKPGFHTFSVIATDPAGNADPTPAGRSFEVAARRRGPRRGRLPGRSQLYGRPVDNGRDAQAVFAPRFSTPASLLDVCCGDACDALSDLNGDCLSNRGRSSR